MPSSTKESPITKVIFLQKIFRFAGRTVKDLVIINNVCKDFEVTMQAHHTFNLVLYDNIIKKRKDELTYEKDHYSGHPTIVTFFERSVRFLSAAPAWIVYQWTVVNDKDESQREILKAFLLYQAENEHRILIRKSIKNEDSATTRELFRHVLDSCIRLKIVKKTLEASSNAWNCIMQAVLRRMPVDTFKLLIESCARHGLGMRIMLEQRSGEMNHIMVAVQHQFPSDSFSFLIKSCIQYRVNIKKMLEEKDNDDRTVIMLAVSHQLPAESFKLLLETCIQHGVDMKSMLEHKDFAYWTCFMLAFHYQYSIDSVRLLIANFPSNESFRSTLAAENRYQKRAVDCVTTEELKTLLEDPDCWKKCREWRK